MCVCLVRDIGDHLKEDIGFGRGVEGEVGFPCKLGFAAVDFSLRLPRDVGELALERFCVDCV